MCNTTRDKNAAAPGPGSAVTTPPNPPPAVTPIFDSVTQKKKFKNPLNDPAQATVLTQVNTPSISTPEQFNEERKFHIFVPKKLVNDFHNAPAGSKPKARVSIFFGVGVEMSLFRLRDFFANETNSVLIVVPGVETEDTSVPASEDDWRGIHIGFGIGISTQMIKDLMTLAGLPGIEFTVEAMAGYSTGYRGVNLTVINKLVDLTNLKRLIYFDAWYHHDDHPKMTSGPYVGKNTRFAIETAFTQNADVQIVIYAFTHPGGVPRSNPSQTNQNIPNPPNESVSYYRTKFPGHINFIDFEFKDPNPAIDVALEKICLARLIKFGIGGPFTAAAIAAPLKALVDVLPERGSFGTLGLTGFTDIYGWINSHNTEISNFKITDAMQMVTTHNLLGSWTTTSHYEMRHRMFVIELGKEPLLP
jgi:hypothetical protein